MNNLSASEMTSISALYQLYLKHPAISTDTRAITNGSLFFALKGDNFNANEFAKEAIEKGAAFAVIDDVKFALNENYIVVQDVLTALQELAKFHREHLKIPVIGLTGSNGKTTTKELIRAVLAEKYKTFATKGNLNNHIGVPLSILSITNEIEIAIIEMGANHQKEIEMLCEIAQPTHGLITNIGMAHLDGFGGFEGVKKGKAELYAYLKKTQGEAFIYRDNSHLMEMSQVAGLNKIVYYGSEQENFVSGKLIHVDPFIELTWAHGGTLYQAKANLTGTYNFENILAAICLGNFFEVKPEEINKGLGNYFPVNNRSQLTKTDNNLVICDFYNANPSSMTAALNNLNTLSAPHKTAILGDMFELGAEAPAQHLEVINYANSLKLEELIFIGENFYKMRDQCGAKFFITRADAHQYLTENAIMGSLILLKGSRGVALEQLLELL